MIGIMKDIAVILGVFISSITVLGIIIKPLRKGIVNWIRDTGETDRIEVLAQGQADLLEQLKTLNGMIVNNQNRVNETSDIQNEALQGLLRDNITGIYYRGLESKTIKDYDKQDLIKLTNSYKKLNGNCYVHEIYEEMKSWTVVK